MWILLGFLLVIIIMLITYICMKKNDDDDDDEINTQGITVETKYIGSFTKSDMNDATAYMLSIIYQMPPEILKTINVILQDYKNIVKLKFYRTHENDDGDRDYYIELENDNGKINDSNVTTNCIIKIKNI